jgi:hypothetical protein
MNAKCALATITGFLLISFPSILYGQDTTGILAELDSGTPFILDLRDFRLKEIESSRNSSELPYVKTAYRLNNRLSFLLDIDNLYAVDNFDEPKNNSILNDENQEKELSAYMVMTKISPRTRIYKPYLLAGVGVLSPNLPSDAPIFGKPRRRPEDDIEAGAKIGFGVDLIPGNNCSIGIKGDYIFGFGDLEEIRNFKLTFGANFLF